MVNLRKTDSPALIQKSLTLGTQKRVSINARWYKHLVHIAPIDLASHVFVSNPREPKSAVAFSAKGREAIPN
jgi:hypothetical protein